MALGIACGVGMVAVLGIVHVMWLRPHLKWKRIARNEASAVAALRAYLGAQGAFQRKDRYGKGDLRYANPIDGKGFPDLYRIGGPDGTGEELKLISRELARATSPETAKDGYWFVDIVSDKIAGDYDFTNACGLCAVPAVYGETGIHTWVIDLTGTAYRVENGGKPLTSFPLPSEILFFCTCGDIGEVHGHAPCSTH